MTVNKKTKIKASLSKTLKRATQNKKLSSEISIVALSLGFLISIIVWTALSNEPLLIKVSLNSFIVTGMAIFWACTDVEEISVLKEKNVMIGDTLALRSNPQVSLKILDITPTAYWAKSVNIEKLIKIPKEDLNKLETFETKLKRKEHDS